MTDAPRRAAKVPELARLVAHSPGMRALVALIRAVADSDCTVLITGETGVGKECVARAIHALSRRAAARLFAVHCAAIPPTLLEAELFGHERGAFTGAEARQKGAFEAAIGGTFLLDEIGELEPPLQVKLLRVLQEKEILRLGSTDPVPVDVRILATTNRNLRTEVEAGRFRPDLFFRLNTVEAHVPPLRERREDILALAADFLAEVSRNSRLSYRQRPAGPLAAGTAAVHPIPDCGLPDSEIGNRQSAIGNPAELSPAASTCLLRYDWPGNVRELRSVIERACLLSAGPRVEPRHLPPEVVLPTGRLEAGGDQREARGNANGDFRFPIADFRLPIQNPQSKIENGHDPASVSASLDFRSARRQFERDYFVRLLIQCGGNISAAARCAGLSWKHLHHKVRELHIRPDALP